jgi:serine/threonine protein kinase
VNELKRNEETLFEVLSQLPLPERSASLEQACGSDSALRERLEILLAAHDRASGFMAESVAPAVPGNTALRIPVAERLGDQIGPYKLLQRIGEGGCGVVYMAQQEQPVRRLVALKVIKLGMDTKQVVARFEAERQALALMDHPNIAKVLDAGATDTGRPYFVMELVRGVKITQYCDQNQLATDERLDLFIQVCRAVQHAHQKGVIHRDLKPSNILVTVNDGVPVPKVIDFGIAKATQGRLTDMTLVTAFDQFIGTPAYVSPEQALMTSLDIDTRSDIYSLGVLLYELLTGTTPFDTKQLLAAGLDEMRRTICEKQPDRPSTRIRQTSAAALARSPLAARHSSLPTDLDWIVMKCLEKDRARRYETVNGLARDIQRHLENEPVSARPPSRLYELQKIVRRHSFGFAAAAALLIVLMAGVASSSLEAIHARRAEAQSKERLADSEAISTFLTQVFQSPDPAQMGRGRTITVAESLGAAARKLERELLNQPVRRAKLQATLGLTYYALGLDREAIPLQEKVRDFYLSAFGPESLETVQAMQDLANSYYRAGRPKEALKLREQVLALRQKLNGPEHPDTLNAMVALGYSYAIAGRREIQSGQQPETNEAESIPHGKGLEDKGIQLMETAVALSGKVMGATHQDTLAAMASLAYAYGSAGRVDRALTLCQEVLAVRLRVSGPEHPATLVAKRYVAGCYHALGRLGEAIDLGGDALAEDKRVLGPEHPETLNMISDMALFYEQSGHMGDAIRLHEEAVLLRTKVSGLEHRETQQEMWRTAKCYAGVGRGKEAIDLARQLFEANPTNSYWSLNLATWQAWFGPEADYQTTRERLVKQVEATQEIETAARAAHAYCLRASTNATLLNKALELAQKAAGIDKSNAWIQLELGMAQYRNGRFAPAESTLKIAAQTAGQFSDLRGTARFYCALSLAKQNRTPEARLLFHEAQEKMRPLPRDECNPFEGLKPFEQNHDLLIWWLAYKEAKAELGEGPTPTLNAAPDK